MNTLSTQRVVIFTAWDLITSTGLLWAPILGTSFGSFGVSITTSQIGTSLGNNELVQAETAARAAV